MSENVYIDVENAWLKFRIYKNRSPALKEAIISKFKPKPNITEITEFDALKNINLILFVNYVLISRCERKRRHSPAR